MSDAKDTPERQTFCPKCHMDVEVCKTLNPPCDGAVTSNELAIVNKLMNAPFATAAMRREAAETIARLMVERDDAKADYARVHRDYMNYRYGGSPPGTPPGRLADETRPQAPIAKLTVWENGIQCTVSMYAPGLPPGEHDVYLDPRAPGIPGSASPVYYFCSHCCRDVPMEHKQSCPGDRLRNAQKASAPSPVLDPTTWEVDPCSRGALYRHLPCGESYAMPPWGQQAAREDHAKDCKAENGSLPQP